MTVDVEALQAELAAAARSWTDDLADALPPGTARRPRRMFARVADAFPAAYQEDFPAEQAVDDLDAARRPRRRRSCRCGSGRRPARRRATGG